MNDESLPPWILLIEELSAVLRAQLDERFPVLAIDATRAIDLMRWMEEEQHLKNPMLSRSKKEQDLLIESVRERGVEQPVVLDADTLAVVDGHHRLQAYTTICGELGENPPPFAGFRLISFTDDTERLDYQTRHSVLQRAMGLKAKKALARDAIMRHLDWADNRLGALVGLDQETVTKLSNEMVLLGEIKPRPKDRIGADGRSHPAAGLRKRKEKKQSKEEAHEGHLLQHWFTLRGSHLTAVEDLVRMVKALGLDFKAFGGMKPKDVFKEEVCMLSWAMMAAENGVPGKYELAVVRVGAAKEFYQLLPKSGFRDDLKLIKFE